jgi:hypothetical protein
VKYLKYFESRIDLNYHSNKERDVLKNLMTKAYKQSKVNGKYILTAYRNEFIDFVKSIRRYNKGELTKKELKGKYISFLKLMGITIPLMVSMSLTLAIILSFKKWGLENYLPDAFKKEIEQDEIDKI